MTINEYLEAYNEYEKDFNKLSEKEKKKEAEKFLKQIGLLTKEGKIKNYFKK